MNLLDLVHRQTDPQPWVEGEKIPWHDPAFSQRMLSEHLSQEHDAASRRSEIIDRHVDWIHRELLSAEPTRILDLGCGPGLYTSRLAALGHECQGIDFGPASIAYAREQAKHTGLRCEYLQDDIRRADYGQGFGLVMLIFGEFNVFHPADAQLIVRKAYAALSSQGILLLEPHTFEAVRDQGGCSRWYTTESGLFSDQPHLYLYESHWNEESRVTIERYFIVDARTSRVTRQAAAMQAYTQPEYEALLTSCGFRQVTFFPSLCGKVDDSSKQLIVIVGRKNNQ